MKRRSIAARAAAWSFAFVLVLKACVPILATAAAALQGVAVGEVCSVYGVALPRADDAPALHAGPAGHAAHHLHQGHGSSAGHAGSPAHDGPAHDGAAHGGDHCALTALAAFAAGAEPGVAVHAAALALRRADAAIDAIARRDASARWASLLAHAPPASRSA